MQQLIASGKANLLNGGYTEWEEADGTVSYTAGNVSYTTDGNEWTGHFSLVSVVPSGGGWVVDDLRDVHC